MCNVAQDVLDAVRKAHGEGTSSSEIADVVGISRTHAYRAIKALGLPLERDMNRTVRAVVSLHQEGLTINQIASRLDISQGHVRRALYRTGIDSDDWNMPSFEPEYHPIETLDPIWAAEFRGFFYADGCITLEPGSGGANGFRPGLYINQREDNAAVLYDIESKLGGNTYIASKQSDRDAGLKSHDQARWYVVGYSGCKAVIEATNLHQPVTRANKAAQARILYQAILARLDMPSILREEDVETLERFHQELCRAKRFSC